MMYNWLCAGLLVAVAQSDPVSNSSAPPTGLSGLVLDFEEVGVAPGEHVSTTQVWSD